MTLPITRRYCIPVGQYIRPVGPLFPGNLLSVVGKADALLALAYQRASDLEQSAEISARDVIEKAHNRAQLLKTELAVTAQREVWEGVLLTWLTFVEGVRSQQIDAGWLALETVKSLLSKLQIETTLQQKLVSSVALLLEQQIRDVAGELRVCVAEADYVRITLDSLGQSNIIVLPDKTLCSGDCVLRCGEFFFRTNFQNNVQVLLDAVGSLQVIEH
jgi:hypothetical protein